jgi:hypothetical protein
MVVFVDSNDGLVEITNLMPTFVAYKNALAATNHLF